MGGTVMQQSKGNKPLDRIEPTGGKDRSAMGCDIIFATLLQEIPVARAKDAPVTGRSHTWKCVGDFRPSALPVNLGTQTRQAILQGEPVDTGLSEEIVGQPGDDRPRCAHACKWLKGQRLHI